MDDVELGDVGNGVVVVGGGGRDGIGDGVVVVGLDYRETLGDVGCCDDSVVDCGDVGDAAVGAEDCCTVRILQGDDDCLSDKRQRQRWWLG